MKSLVSGEAARTSLSACAPLLMYNSPIGDEPPSSPIESSMVSDGESAMQDTAVPKDSSMNGEHSGTGTSDDLKRKREPESGHVQEVEAGDSGKRRRVTEAPVQTAPPC